MGANTREIRSRIKSIKNTQKITKAMQMVAAAKVRRAQDRVVAAKPYAEAVAKMFRGIVGQLAGGEYNSPLLASRSLKRVLLVVITSDRGLCGGYNSNLLRHAVNRARYWKEEGAIPEIVVVGNKGIAFFRHSNFEVVERFANLPAIPTFAEAQAIAKVAVDRFSEGKADHVEVVSTQFRSMVALIPHQTTLLPATPPVAAGEEPGAKALMIFEPSPEAVLDRLVPKYLETVVYHALLEAAASELAAKMTAMSAASKNAKELADALTLVYNKARQAAITQEILEVVGGAAAL